MRITYPIDAITSIFVIALSLTWRFFPLSLSTPLTLREISSLRASSVFSYEKLRYHEQQTSMHSLASLETSNNQHMQKQRYKLDKMNACLILWCIA